MPEVDGFRFLRLVLERTTIIRKGCTNRVNRTGLVKSGGSGWARWKRDGVESVGKHAVVWERDYILPWGPPGLRARKFSST